MPADTRRSSAAVISVDRDAGTIDIMFDAWCRGDDPPFRIPIPVAMPVDLQRAGCDFTCRIPCFREACLPDRAKAARRALLDPSVLTDFEEVSYGDLSIEELEALIGYKRDTP